MHIIHQIVKIVTLTLTLSPVTEAHGGPAQLVICIFNSPPAPCVKAQTGRRITGTGSRVGRTSRRRTSSIHVHTRTEELAWEGACIIMGCIRLHETHQRGVNLVTDAIIVGYHWKQSNSVCRFRVPYLSNPLGV